MADFSQHIDPLITAEGGYKLIDVPGDRGLRTYAGVSERANPRWPGWKLIDSGADPAEIKASVHELYRTQYWQPIQGGQIMSDDVAEMLFGAAVHTGVRRAIGLAQQVVESEVDGIMGPNTLAAINGMDPERFEERFALAMINRYRTICNRDRSQTKFLLGWLNRIYGELET